MMQNPNEALRTAIAAAAARLVAQDGADYGSAKRKAARQILGERQANELQNFLPDNAQIEEEVRLYHALFKADTQPARLYRLRTLALQVMEQLEQYNPYLTGAVLNGTAGEHNDIHLQLFADSAKEVQIFLLNKNLQIEISQSPHFRGPRYEPVETVSFMWQNEGVHIELYETDDIRGAKKKSGDKLLRADLAEVRTLLTNSSHQ